MRSHAGEDRGRGHRCCLQGCTGPTPAVSTRLADAEARTHGVDVKVGLDGGRVVVVTPEFDDAAALASSPRTGRPPGSRVDAPGPGPARRRRPAPQPPRDGNEREGERARLDPGEVDRDEPETGGGDRPVHRALAPAPRRGPARSRAARPGRRRRDAVRGSRRSREAAAPARPPRPAPAWPGSPARGAESARPGTAPPACRRTADRAPARPAARRPCPVRRQQAGEARRAARRRGPRAGLVGARRRRSPRTRFGQARAAPSPHR